MVGFDINKHSGLYRIFLYVTIVVQICAEDFEDNFTEFLDFRYHSNEELRLILQEFNKTTHLPLRTKLHSIGQTIDKNDLWVLEITAAHPNTANIPNVKLIGNIHGNEVVGREVLLHFLYYLRNEYYKRNATIVSLLNTTRIHILPAMNPDGFNRSKPSCAKDDGRNNGKGHVDLNRSFEDMFHKNSVKPQPETCAIMKWMQQVPFLLSASLHGGALVANYPFDTVKEPIAGSNYHLRAVASPTPDDDVFKHLTAVYANNHREMHLGLYCDVSKIAFEDGTSNGAEWYTVVGGMQDYNYFKHGCMELTLEISCCKYPEADTLQKHWIDNREALVALIGEAHRGVYGRVFDITTEEPIKASLLILGRNMTFHSFTTGEYWRILLPGNFTIKATAPGYYDKVETFQITEELKKIQLDILLMDCSIPTTTPESTTSIEENKEFIENLTASINISCDLISKRHPRNIECPLPDKNTMESRGNLIYLNIFWMVMVKTVSFL